MPQQDYAFLQINDLIDSGQLAMVRWIALGGQLLTVLIAYLALDFAIPIYWLLLIILISAVIGIWQHWFGHVRTRINNYEAFFLLGFDTLQLFGLLFLTGGLTNPFALLLLAPVAVSASLLSMRYTISLILLVAFLASLLSVYHIPLPWPDASPQWPWLYLVGLWVAIVFAVGFIGIYIGLLTNQARHILRGLSDARFNMAREQQVVSLGSLATVAAHKLGSPLNTITLITHELGEMLDEKVDYETLANEIMALKVETERCRMILAGLSEDANQIDQMSQDPVSVLALVQGLIDDRFADIRDMIRVQIMETVIGDTPKLGRRPDIIHSLEMMIDNAAQFARNTVNIALGWDKKHIYIRVTDDGPGFMSAVLNRLGEPYNSSRKGEDGHMGLGLFIATTMIEGLGGQLVARNVKDGGAEITFILPRAEIDVQYME
jgi:two-component system sensor histidine kinase RegB